MRQFYIYYPNFPDASGKSQNSSTLSSKSLKSERLSRKSSKWQTVSAKSQKSQTLSHQLSWSHYVELLGISDDLARSFYEKQCIKESWSVRELKRQKDSMLFERIALSKDKKGVLELSKKGQLIEKDEDIIKEPYVLEFLGIPENYKYSEKELEQKIIDNLQMFLLELEKGFTFVDRQKRISLGGDHYYIDLVFYNRLLQCFVLIDLKIGKLKHQDVGQMQMYVNIYDREVKSSSENPTVGLILCKEKNELVIKYTLSEENKQIFAKEYQLYLPKKEELEKQMKRLLDN